jgi:ATP-binding cassette, subfamily B, bacterial
MFISQGSGGGGVNTFRATDPALTQQQLRRGIVRRMLPYLRPYRLSVAFLLAVTLVDAVIVVSIPLLLREVIDGGILAQDARVVITMASIAAALGVLDAVMQFYSGYFSARIGQGVSYELRTEVFDHVQRQPLAFFTRTQTGSLVSRLNTDIVESQQAITLLLTSSVSSILIMVLVLAELFYLSWQVSVVALVLIPLFVLPGKRFGRRLQRYAREQMQLNAELGATMNERFNVAGAMLAKLYGRPREEAAMFAQKANRVRDVGISTTVNGRLWFISMALLASLVTALVYGLGGTLAISGAFQIGTLVALAALLNRLYGPIQQLSGLQANTMTALVSFDRVFEVLDLKPLIAEQPGAAALPAAPDGAAPEVEFDRVTFRYPKASDVSLATLESLTLPSAERSRDTGDVLHEVSFQMRPGTLTALVGPSGGGKTTITHLVSRLYDPDQGAVRMDGHDLRELTLDSLREAVGVVTQDAHLYHDTIRGNLAYARPGATAAEMTEACRAAQIWDLVEGLPDGLDTVVGDRGYRLSGGEKQRIALARLLLKAPSIVVLDEATAHLDSESEAAIQRALKTALAGRTSLVIAHRLSTIREADQILVIDGGQVRERGTHEELLAAGGLYAELYRTQFARQATRRGDGDDDQPPPPERAPDQVPAGPGLFTGNGSGQKIRLGAGGFGPGGLQP